MPTKSQIVSDADIQVFKDSVDKWKQFRIETQFALDAGLTPQMSLKDIDNKIAAAIKVIEAYTGMPYRP